MRRIVAAVFLVCVISGCDGFSKNNKANELIVDQSFKSAIALVELYHLRNGVYPATLSDVDYLGTWDAGWLGTVQYKRLDEGYELDYADGYEGKPPMLQYPAAFWKNLGIKRTNAGGKP